MNSTHSPLCSLTIPDPVSSSGCTVPLDLTSGSGFATDMFRRASNNTLIPFRTDMQLCLAMFRRAFAHE